MDGPRNSVSAKAFKCLAVSGLKAIGPNMPGRSFGKSICAIRLRFDCQDIKTITKHQDVSSG